MRGLLACFASVACSPPPTHPTRASARTWLADPPYLIPGAQLGGVILGMHRRELAAIGLVVPAAPERDSWYVVGPLRLAFARDLDGHDAVVGIRLDPRSFPRVEVRGRLITTLDPAVLAAELPGCRDAPDQMAIACHGVTLHTSPAGRTEWGAPVPKAITSIEVHTRCGGDPRVRGAFSLRPVVVRWLGEQDVATAEPFACGLVDATPSTLSEPGSGGLIPLRGFHGVLGGQDVGQRLALVTPRIGDEFCFAWGNDPPSCTGLLYLGPTRAAAVPRGVP